MRPGKNEPCPCGSGRKYKKCCIFSDNIKNSDPSLKSIKKVPTVKQNTIDTSEESINMLYKGLIGMRSFFLKKKPHIKEYQKIRKMHEDVIASMMEYHEDGKVENPLRS